MSTLVFVLEHGWDEGGSEIRGIYFDEGQARKDLPVEVHELEGVCTTIRHDDFCCSVGQYEVRDRAVSAVALPEKPFHPLTSERIINQAVKTHVRTLQRRPDAEEVRQ